MRNWAELPEELLSLILSNLFAKDKYSFGRVCKSWSSAAAVSPYRHSPCLMFYEKNNDRWKFFQYNGIFFRKFPQLYDSEILCSKHGWLLMSCYYCNLFFFDPFNYRSIEVLPVMDFPYKTICFFKPPTSSDCTIVGISSVLAFSPCVKIGVLKMGEGEWKIHKYNCNTRFVFSGCTPIMHRGMLYYLDVKGNVGTFNINKHGHESSWVVHTKCLLPARFRNKTKQHFFIKHHGEETLFAVFVAHDERKVNVYRLLEPGMKWELVEDLGDKRLFVSRTSSIIETAPLKSMANRIHFPMSHDDVGIYYSLDTRKYHSYKGDFSAKKSYRLTELNFATWVIPTPTPEFHEELTWCSKVG
ncbi:hypothetical protein BUALT_Bualt08G0107100 [Buddleja alternifolia]|uniref:F-box domain-containing protein n=1 Tax=Buddleja alternifolia TaxID=168488 RepID=A0AAV6X994_9LAMI|nr:hypothetical protein BUALT_Bualt08G0107100 [Buddleja alternifolia]